MTELCTPRVIRGTRAVAVVASLFLGVFAHTAAAQVATDSLTPAGEAAFDSGVVAYQQQRWNDALRHFATALWDRGGVSFAPQVAFNLGMTHAAAGNELGAAAWLQTYLLAAPEARNRAVVETAIQRLDSAASEKIERMLREAAETANGFAGEDRSNALARVAMEHALAGDFNGAVRISKARSTDGAISAHAMDFIRALYAVSLLLSGDDMAAQSALSQLQTDVNQRHSALHEVLDEAFRRLADRLQSPYGDFAAARAAIAKIRDPVQREQASALLAGWESYPPGTASLPQNWKANSLCARYLAQSIDYDDLSTLLDDLRSTAGADPVSIPARLGALAAMRAVYFQAIRGLRRGVCPSEAFVNGAVISAKNLGGLPRLPTRRNETER